MANSIYHNFAVKVYAAQYRKADQPAVFSIEYDTYNFWTDSSNKEEAIEEALSGLPEPVESYQYLEVLVCEKVERRIVKTLDIGDALPGDGNMWRKRNE